MRIENELNRRRFLKWANMLGLSAVLPASITAQPSVTPFANQDAKSAGAPAPQSKESPLPNKILLKDYRPKSIYKIPVTQIDKAKHPIIDMHSHPYAKTPQQIDEWLKNMDEV